MTGRVASARQRRLPSPDRGRLDDGRVGLRVGQHLSMTRSRSSIRGTSTLATKQSSPVTRSHSMTSGISATSWATRCNSPIAGRMRIWRLPSPSADGSRRTVKPVITPRSSSRRTRSEVLCGDNPISRARSAVDVRALRSSASIRRRCSRRVRRFRFCGDLPSQAPKPRYNRSITAERSRHAFHGWYSLVMTALARPSRPPWSIASRPMRFSWSARCSIISGRRSRCCCSAMSACSASPGCASLRPPPFSRLAPALAHPDLQRSALAHSDPRARRHLGADELGVLFGDRPYAAGDGRRDRVRRHHRHRADRRQNAAECRRFGDRGHRASSC